MKPLQKEFLGSLCKKILLLPATYFFIVALQPIGVDFLIYFALTLFDWMLFMLCLIGAALLDLLISHPELRNRMRRQPKAPQAKPTVKPKEQKKKEEKIPLY